MLFLFLGIRKTALFLFTLAVLLLPIALHATHLQGGEVKYAYLGQNAANGLHQYRITFYIYNNCASGSQIPNGKPQIVVNIYNKDTNQRIAGPDNTFQQQGLWFFQRGQFPVITNPLPLGCNIPTISNLCIRYITYERVVELPVSFSGYYVIYDDFARTNSILNLQNPGNTGQSIYTDMTAPTRPNSSPEFSDLAVAIICSGDTVQLSNNAIDPDGDFLVYSFDQPLDDVLGPDNSPIAWTQPANIPYAPGYSFTQPFGANGFASINANTGVTRYYAPTPGDYVVSVLIKEFRMNPDGSQTQIGFTRRELMLFVRNCPPNVTPSFSQATLNNLVTSVQAGSQTCLFIMATDPANEQLTITVPASSIPTGATFAPALPTVGTSQVGNQFCWTPPCNASGTIQMPVRVTDNGCPPKFIEQVFTINVTPLPEAVLSGLELGNFCLGSGPVAMSGTPVGGVFSGPGVSANSFNPTTAGLGTHTITYTYTSASGCVTTASQAITVNQGPSVSVTGLDPTYCLSSAPVTLTPTPTGGVFTGPGINGNVFNPSLAGVGQQIITYSITSPNGCTSQQQYTTNVIAQPAVTVTPNANLCSGSSLNLQATGANTYTWTNNQNSNVLTGAQVNVSPAANTVYTVTGVVSSGCNATATTTVSVFPVPAVMASASQTAVCAGTATQLTATGATTYTWQPGNITGNIISVTPTATTSYTVTGTAAGGCTNTASVPITVNALPAVTATATQNICAGGSATITASGATTYVWQPGGSTSSTITVSPAVNTTYTVTGTGPNGCSNTAVSAVNVAVVPVATISLNGPTTFCEGDNVQLTAATGTMPTIYGFSWLLDGNPIPGASGPIFTPTVSGTYTFSIFLLGSQPCSTLSNAITITVNPRPVVALPGIGSFCASDAPVTLAGTPTGGVYSGPGISGAVFSPTAAGAGTHNISYTFTNASGCSATATIPVLVNPVPVLAQTPSQAICAGTQVTLTATGADFYTWQPGNLTGNSITVSPAATTTYSVTGSSAAGCVNTASTTVTVNPLPVVSAVVPVAICAGETATLTASGAVTYIWEPGNLSGSVVTVSPTTTTVYTVTGTDANGCSSTDTRTLIVNPLPEPVSISGIKAFCSGIFTGLTFSIPATTGNTYTWAISGGTFTSATNSPSVVVDLFGNQSASISVTETSAAGCTGPVNSLTIVYDTASAEMIVVTVAPDNEQELLVNWEIPGQVTLNELFIFRRPSGAANWSLIAVRPGATTNYTDNPGDTDALSFEYQVRTTNSCDDSLFTVPQRSILLEGLATESTAEANLNWNSYRGWPAGVREYQLYRRIDNEPSFTLYQTLTDTSAVFSPGREGFVQCFRIKAISNDATARESWSNSICLNYENPLSIPNVITPNGDGKNDFFVIDNIGLYAGAELVVLNRWGKEIFRKTDYRNDWSPDSNVPTGMYYYQLVLRNKTVLKGWLTILR